MEHSIQSEHSTSTGAEASTYREASEEVSEYLWKQRSALLYDVRFATIYHRKRERFLDWLDRATKALSIIGGSAAFALVPGAKWFALGVAVISALSLVWDYAVRARLHGDLARRFLDIEADMEECGERDFSEQDIKSWRARFIRIEAEEPPLLRGLAKICQEELNKSMGKDYAQPSWFARVKSHIS